VESTRNATLLKYRFGVFEHMQNHLHVVDGRTLFFFRDPRILVSAGARVVVQFSFSANDQVSTLRGSVLGRVDSDGSQSGVWIEFPDAKLARKIDSGITSLTGRHQRRLGCDMLVELKLDRRPHMGRMVDVSLGAVRIASPVDLSPGTDLELRIMGAEPPMPGSLGRARVVRAESGGDLAVSFVRSDVIARVASSKLYSAVQEAWAKAPEGMHSSLCCQDGRVLEPPLPHMKNRT